MYQKDELDEFFSRHVPLWCGTMEAGGAAGDGEGDADAPKEGSQRAEGGWWGCTGYPMSGSLSGGQQKTSIDCPDADI